MVRFIEICEFNVVEIEVFNFFKEYFLFKIFKKYRIDICFNVVVFQ